ncbi:MAG: hypothetical protein PUK40_04030 [Actinomycetaceae bacterium]|nr:hypothetical protein [Arcanobacterium sp.]MDD7505105.1 hypothetical protein [Actinomycetaceae bacterium]MDY6142622.1 hypothetical protein [Arcanobacterium sp.]
MMLHLVNSDVQIPEPIRVEEFLASIPDPQLRADSIELARIMEEETGQAPILWGPSIIGFGRFDTMENRHCLCDGLEVGFAPRAECGQQSARIVLYLRHYSPHYHEFLQRIGDIHAGRASISMPRLADVDQRILRDLIRFAWRDIDR